MTKHNTRIDGRGVITASLSSVLLVKLSSPFLIHTWWPGESRDLLTAEGWN
jgi:hypothetical protein